MPQISGNSTSITGPVNDNAITAYTLLALVSSTVSQATSTQYKLDNVRAVAFGVSYETLVFTGTGFTYHDGVPTGGTVNRVEQPLWDGQANGTGMLWTGLNVSWATFWDDMIAAQSTGDLTPINNLFFGGNDTFTAYVNGTTFHGFAGDDIFNMGDHFVGSSVDGGAGTDTLNITGNSLGNFTNNAILNFPEVLQPDRIAGIERINISGSYSCALRWLNGTDAGVSSVTLDASALSAPYVFYFDGSRENVINFTLSGGAGNDTLIGGAGNDTVKYARNRVGYVFSVMSNGGYTITGPDGIDQLKNIENVAFSDETVTLPQFAAPTYSFLGNNAAETLTGTSGNDAIFGQGGADVLIGGGGNDVLSGGDAGDTLNGGAGDDILDGGDNIDTAVFSGTRAAYSISQTSTGMYRVVGPDGSDNLLNVEYAKFDDQTLRLLPGSGKAIDFSAAPSTFMTAIRDFDGNDLGSASSWRLAGTADVNGDGTAEHIFFNRTIGRWAEVGTEADGKTYFANNGWAGNTRVVGIYIDPLVTQGVVVKDSDTDSQRRFRNDLQIDNIKGILGQADYNKDGLQEIYFSLTDGTAYLHAYMHADGNIQYANYQSKQQVIDYMTTNGVASSVYSSWFSAAQTPMAAGSLSPDLGASNLVMAPLGVGS